MTARDVMRSAAVDPGHIVGERQLGETLPRWQVRAILTALSEAGFSIVHESEIHGATRERCIAAVEAEQLTDNIDVPGDHAYRLAINDALDAIRALPDGGVEETKGSKQ